MDVSYAAKDFFLRFDTGVFFRFFGDFMETYFFYGFVVRFERFFAFGVVSVDFRFYFFADGFYCRMIFERYCFCDCVVADFDTGWLVFRTEGRTAEASLW